MRNIYISTFLMCTDVDTHNVCTAVGNFVWNDVDGDGQQDFGEAGLAGVSITLKTCARTVVAAVVSGINGEYLFDDVIPGCYFLVFEVPSGMFPTVANVASDYTDSDIDQSGETSQFLLNPGVQTLSADAGFIGSPSGRNFDLFRLPSLYIYIYTDRERERNVHMFLFYYYFLIIMFSKSLSLSLCVCVCVCVCRRSLLLFFAHLICCSCGQLRVERYE